MEIISSPATLGNYQHRARDLHTKYIQNAAKVYTLCKLINTGWAKCFHPGRLIRPKYRVV